MEEIKLSNPDLEALLHRGLAALAPEDETFVHDREAYRLAASVLVSFDPELLHPYGIDYYEEKGALRYLMDDCRVTSSENYQKIAWSLDNEVRRESLRKLIGGNEIKAALSVNPHERRKDNVAQSLFEGYLTGQPMKIDEMSIEQLQVALLVVQWLDEIISPMQTIDEIRNRLNTLKFFERFRKLVTDGFAGRREELEKLNEHTGLSNKSKNRGGKEKSDRFTAPLTLYGPGGVGKTTLMAKFILESTEDGKNLNFPLIYFDFDDAALGSSLSSPLLSETLRLLDLQYPGHARVIERVRRRTSVFLKGEAEALRIGESISTVDYLRIDPNILDRLERFFVDNIAFLIKTIFRDVYHEEPAASTRPFLLILDTFENVQHTSEGKVKQIWKYIALLGEQIPNLKVIIAGRDALDTDDLPGDLPETVVLGNLNEQATTLILRKYGITDEKRCNEIFQLTDGNPLSLRLAAAASKSGVLDISSVKQSVDLHKTEKEISTDNVMQGQLYERLLIHIDDERVRRLANPGLTLRIISPKIILEVLNKPCRLKIHNIEEAKELMAQLEKASLVVKEGDCLRHRADVRRIMIKLIDRAEPGLVLRINQLAVRFYENEEGLEARAEEIYHRLRLGQDPSVVDPRWLPGIEDFLQGAIDELPGRSQVFLAQKLGLEVKKEIREGLVTTEWEQITLLKARDFMKHGQIKAAELLLLERAERSPDSPLYLIEAEISAVNRHWQEALQKIRLAEQAAINASDAPMQLEAIYLEARVAYQLNNYELTETLARRAERLAQEIEDPSGRLRASVLRYKALSAMGQTGKIATVQKKIVEAFNETREKEPITDKALLRDVASALAGGTDSELFNEAFRASGFGAVSFGALLRTLSSFSVWLKRSENHSLAITLALQIDPALIMDSFNAIKYAFGRSSTGSKLTRQVLQLLELLLAERPDDPSLQKVIATALESPSPKNTEVVDADTGR